MAQATVRAPVAIGTTVGVGVQPQEVAMGMGLDRVGLQPGAQRGLDLDMDLGPVLGPVTVTGLEAVELAVVVMDLERVLDLLKAAQVAVAQAMMETEMDW